MDPLVSWSPAAWGASAAFDIVLLVFVLAKLPANIRAKLKFERLVFKDGLLFFLILASVNIAMVVMSAMGTKFEYIKGMVLPFAVTITYAMGARVYLNLKAYRERKLREKQGLPVSQNSAGTVVSSGTASSSRPIAHPRYGSPQEPRSFLPLKAPSVSYRSSDDSSGNSAPGPFISITKEIHIAR